MAVDDEFRKAFGHGTQVRVCGPADEERLKSVVPEFLLELWKEDGWASYRDGLLWTVDPKDFESVVRAWKLPDRPPIAVARTAFGSLYLLREFVTKKGTPGFAILELNPHTGHYMVVGPSAKPFLFGELAQPDYIKTVLREADAQLASKDQGPLAWDEMYGYEPALALGGSREPAHVRRVNIFAHHQLLSQLVDVELRKL
jgi:hypothetical protein